MIDINKYPDSFINYVNENIVDLANEEAELCGENVADIIIDCWEDGKYDDIENEIDIWFECFDEGSTNSIEGEQAKQEYIN